MTDLAAARQRMGALNLAEEAKLVRQLIAESLGTVPVQGEVDLGHLAGGKGFDAVAWFGDDQSLRPIRVALSRRPGAILPLLHSPAEGGRLLLERHLCIDTTAAGGNTTLMAQAN